MGGSFLLRLTSHICYTSGMTQALAPTQAEQLVELATLTRNEWAARLRFDYASRIVGAIPEGEADDDDLDWVTNTYVAWCKAWEALTAARRELGDGA